MAYVFGSEGQQRLRTAGSGDQFDLQRVRGRDVNDGAKIAATQPRADNYAE